MGGKGKIGVKAVSRRELEGLQMNLTVVFQLKAYGRNPPTLENTDCKRVMHEWHLYKNKDRFVLFCFVILIIKRFKMSQSTLWQITRGQVACKEKKCISLWKSVQGQDADTRNDLVSPAAGEVVREEGENKW